MTGPSSGRCVCTDGNRPDVRLHVIMQAVAVDDVDRAIDAGLLQWNGCTSCAIAEGLSGPDLARLIETRDARLAAMATRERYRARQQRLQLRSEQRNAQRSAMARTMTATSCLPSAAAAALARAKAKAAAARKP